jgi:hypothetical protein
VNRTAPAGATGDRDAAAELDLDTATGLWLVLSSSQTVYRLDLDHRMLRREPGPDSARGPFDNEWVPLVRVEVLCPDLSTRETRTLAVGRRHLYVTDPIGGGADYRWWLQRTAEVIRQVTP